ncbi:hypothetical protein OG897_06030 [Streptomyces sp. NBC_00237]|uniref:hypothetical protein n=1 Tax=Streptomyces sp. NBC_00237 TaxID=2975687 RepID=UPI002252A287|nr:hypothetical protein [Streptomyces sp. NBC_00237]MCX5201019.1 hypothetical protein [Streptomyces sp. NBC_00237]
METAVPETAVAGDVVGSPSALPASAAAGRTAASHATAQHWPSPESSEAPEAAPLDLVTVPARQGLEAVDILRRASASGAGLCGAVGSAPAAVGPVLHDGRCDTVGFLVPPGTADGWDMPGSACTQTLGRGVSFGIPAPTTPTAPEPPVTGTGWLLPPTETVPVTDPAALRRALGEAARLIEAADRCR